MAGVSWGLRISSTARSWHTRGLRHKGKPIISNHWQSPWNTYLNEGLMQNVRWVSIPLMNDDLTEVRSLQLRDCECDLQSHADLPPSSTIPLRCVTYLCQADWCVGCGLSCCCGIGNLLPCLNSNIVNVVQTPHFTLYVQHSESDSSKACPLTRSQSEGGTNILPAAVRCIPV